MSDTPRIKLPIESDAEVDRGVDGMLRRLRTWLLDAFCDEDGAPIVTALSLYAHRSDDGAAMWDLLADSETGKAIKAETFTNRERIDPFFRPLATRWLALEKSIADRLRAPLREAIVAGLEEHLCGAPAVRREPSARLGRYSPILDGA